jgi:hypothetical protein
MTNNELQKKINLLREYLNRNKSLDNPGLESSRLLLADYDRMRLSVSTLIGELGCRKRVSAKEVSNKLLGALWESEA